MLKTRKVVKTMYSKRYSDVELYNSNAIITSPTINSLLVLFHHIHGGAHFLAVGQDLNNYYGFEIKDGLVVDKQYPITEWHPDDILDNNLPPAFIMEDAFKLYL